MRFKNNSLIYLLIKLWTYFGRRRQSQFIMLTLLMLICAFAEVVSLGAVLPFLGVLVVPEKIFNFPFMADFGDFFGIHKTDQMVLLLTVLFALIAIFNAITRLIFLKLSTRLALSTGSDISIDIYKRTLYQPFSTHVLRNSSEVISGIVGKVHTIIYGVLLPLLNLVSSIILLTSITVVLFLTNTMVASVITIGFGGSYAILAFFSRRKLNLNSELISIERNKTVKALQEGLGGIRDVLLDELQPVYCEVYRQADLPLRKAEGENTFIAQSPRFVMEGFGLVLIAVLACILSKSSDGISNAIPVLGVFALGAQRLLPALQQCYGSWASIAGSKASLVDTIALLQQELRIDNHKLIKPMLLRSSIDFKDVNFGYQNNSFLVLNRVTFSVKKGMKIAFVGSTGSGKSTLLDLVMGLLTPTEGSISIDGELLNEARLKSWQKTVAHVPQTIYLSDATLAENIAFGVPNDEIDWERMSAVVRQAQLHDFIENSSEGYDTEVGERGVRLSGGQRQRIGIARALYKQASVLIFDEATSALDNKTEKSLMESINQIGRDVTILFVAHRLSTVRNCDLLIELENGEIKAQGTYDELIERSDSFRKMVEIAND